VIRDCFLVYCARTRKISFPPYLQMSETQIANELLHGNLCGSQHFCLNIALFCSPLNTFETWADQQELSKEARCKSAFSTRRRVSLLESSMLLNNLMEARNQKKQNRVPVTLSQILNRSWAHKAFYSCYDAFFGPESYCQKGEGKKVHGWDCWKYPSEGR